MGLPQNVFLPSFSLRGSSYLFRISISPFAEIEAKGAEPPRTLVQGGGGGEEGQVAKCLRHTSDNAVVAVAGLTTMAQQLWASVRTHAL